MANGEREGEKGGGFSGNFQRKGGKRRFRQGAGSSRGSSGSSDSSAAAATAAAARRCRTWVQHNECSTTSAAQLCRA